MYINNVTLTVFGRVDCINRIFPERNAGINRLYYVNSGEMLLNSGGKEIVMKKGHLYLLPHNNVNTITTKFVDHTFLNFYTFPQIANENIIEIKLSEYPVIKSMFDALNMYVTANPGKSIPCKNDSKRTFISSLLSNVLFLIGEIYNINVVEDEFVNRVIEYIHGNFNASVSVSEIAQKFHMEPNSFIRRFKKHANVTPYQYLKRVRVNMALALMKGDKYDMNEIAKKVGYADASALSHAIKKCITV